MDCIRFREALYRFNTIACIDEAFQKGHRAFSGLERMPGDVQDDDSSPVLRVANTLASSER